MYLHFQQIVSQYTFQIIKQLPGWYTGIPATIDGDFAESIWTTKGQYNPATDEFAPGTLLDQRINTNDGGIETGTPPAPPDDALFTSRVTFAVSWDANFLYFAASVKDPSLIAATKPLSGNALTALFLYYNADNITRSFHQKNGNFDITTNSPKVYNPLYDMEIGFNYDSVRSHALILEDGFVNHGGIAFENGEYKAHLKPTANGYHVEAALSWNRLNIAFINSTSVGGDFIYTDNTKKPSHGRAMGFDFTNNIPNSTGTSRQAKIQWNSCCVNRNWTESLNFGTLILNGPISCNAFNCTYGYNITTPSSIINGSSPVQIKSLYDNANYTASVNFSVINPAGSTISIIENDGKLYPLANGIVTVVGASSDLSLGKQYLVLTITNVPAITNIDLHANDITTNFGVSAASITTTPANSSPFVVYSLEPTNLAIVNSVTGVIIASALGNGPVKVKAISLVDPLVTAEKVIQISGQEIPKQIFLFATMDSTQNCSSNPNALTISGISGEEFMLTAFYCANSSVITIPSKFISFQRAASGSSTFSKPTANGNVEIIAAVGFNTLTGTHLLNTSLTSSLRVVLKSKAVQECTYDLIKASVLAGCSSITGLDFGYYDTEKLSIYPNPSEGLFTIESMENESLAFSIYNTMGISLSSGILKKGQNQVQLQLNTGIYILKAGENVKRIFVK